MFRQNVLDQATPKVQRTVGRRKSDLLPILLHQDVFHAPLVLMDHDPISAPVRELPETSVRFHAGKAGGRQVNVAFSDHVLVPGAAWSSPIREGEHANVRRTGLADR